MKIERKSTLLLVSISLLLLGAGRVVHGEDDKISSWQNLFVEGEPEGLVNLAVHYGQNSILNDPQRAYDLLLVASSEFNDSVAQTNLGLLYQFGQGVELNYSRAAYWYQRAAKSNNVNALIKLADMYSRGVGTLVNYEKAAGLYRTAAENGSSDAQVELGYIYETGGLGAADFSTAMELYLQAAKQGNQIGQYNLAEMYELGKGVSVDLEQARQWYTLSADQGLPEALEALQRLR